MLRTEGRGLESHLCQGLCLAGSRWSDIIGSSLHGRGEDSATWIAALEPEPHMSLELWQTGERMRLGEGGSLETARDEVYAVDRGGELKK